MAIIATGSKTIIDLSDGKSLSVYLGANQPRTQIHDVNGNTYNPNWTTTAGKLVITPVVYANQTAIALNNAALTITWKRKEGSGSETALTTGETVSGNILTVNQNKLASITSGLLTYIAYVAYADPDTGLTINATADISFALISTGENAKSAWISGEQVFKYDSAGTVAPSQITLTANLQNVTMGKWQYKNSSGTWTDYPTTSDNANITGTTLIVKPTHAIWVGQSATLRITTSDNSIGDTTSIYKVQDGTPGGAGTDASVVFLTNENITFAAAKDGKIAATTKTCNVVAYTGATKVTPTVGTPTGAPTGMTITVGEAANNEILLTITIAANATLGGSGQLNGVVNVPVTAPVATTLQIQWSKVNTGATGSAGAGAYNLSVYSPTGTVFTNGLAENSDEVTLTALYFQGATDLTTNTKSAYLWEKYESGSWTTVKAEATGSSGNTYTVHASDVQGSATYRCRARYNNGTTYFYDTITIIDKTDNYQADVDSTAGDVFKNTVGQTCLICRLWQNGAEVDPLKSTTYSSTAPSSPSEGDYYYKIASNSPTTALMRYNGSAWVDVTSDASLVTIRKLKEHGCECYFEKENIFTFDGKGELLITIMSSLAQEESRSISENVTWGHRKRMADGKVSIAYSTFLGYDKGPDGNLVVNKEQAKIVRLIYRSFMEGMAPIGICRMLEERGIPSPGGKKKWYEGTVISILTNEKYRGDALLQKTFTVDFLTKKHKINEGEVPQYYVEANHEAIIPPEEFEQVQAEIARRKKIGRSYSGTIFGSKIICGDCGGYYGQKVWHSNDAYRRVVWRCNRKYGKGQRCSTPTITEEGIKCLFVKAFNKLMSERTSAIRDCEDLAATLEDTSELDQAIEAPQNEIDTVIEQNRRLIREQAVTGMPTEEFDERTATLNERYKAADEKLARLKAEREDHLTRGKGIRRFLSALDDQAQRLEDWDEQAWNLLVSRVIIQKDGSAEFIFRGEITITVRAE